MDLMFNPFLAEVREDPYPLYRELRERDPVHVNFPGLWVVTRWEDVTSILRSWRAFGSDARKSELYETIRASVTDVTPVALDQDRGRSMLFVDPPDHTRLRTLVNAAFSARAISRMRPRIQRIVDGLVDAMLEKREADVVTDLAYPLPITVICEMLGVPAADRMLFHRWSGELVATLDPLVPGPVLLRANEAALAFRSYFGALIEERRAHPGPDLLSRLIAARDEGDRLSEDELLATCTLLLVAGHETTVNLVSNGMLALLRHPGELARLRADPSLDRSAVEELLRFDSPVQLTGRTALCDGRVGGVPIPKGHVVLAVLGGANRDPAQFADPDRLDLGRTENRHVAFGAGIHFCLGAPLARIEGELAIAALARRTRAIEQNGEVERRETVTLRGLKRLPVSLVPA